MDSIQTVRESDTGGMSSRKDATIRLLCAACLLVTGCRSAQEVRDIVHPEQRRISYRAPAAFPPAPLPSVAAPRTVTNPDNGEPQILLSLDEAIRIALANSEVIRVLAGFTAVSSGRTIYDPAIANTAIDQARGRFDPMLSVNNTFNQNEQPFGTITPGFPGATINGSQTDGYVFDANLTDTNALGGTAGLHLGVTRSATEPGIFPLNPQTNQFTELSYVQPLLQGGGLNANLAPIIIAGIDTERSFFQFKGSVQNLVQGVIEAYWNLVFARTDRWARQQQVDQATFAFERETARKDRGLADLGDLAQTRSALTSFRANLIAAKAAVLQREAALLSILGISPTNAGEVIPITPPFEGQIDFRWMELVSLTEQYRPDLIELKLIIEADLQRVLVAENNAQPQLDAVALYRWDGLRGRTPGGPTIGTAGGEYTDWTLGVNFSVPLGLRQSRAAVRQQELLVARDRAFLEQGLLTAVQDVALSVRNLDQYHAQYDAFVESRVAARDNLEVQQAEFENGRTIFLNVLQAITTWGNSVSAEAQTLAQYNSELSNLELQTGTILEAHGVRFVEERNRFVGPLGCFGDACYPTAIVPGDNQSRYPTGDKPAEEAFDLENPLSDLGKRPAKSPLELPPQRDLYDSSPSDVPEPPLNGTTPDPPNPASNETPSDPLETLFVPQGFNWIELTRTAGRIEAEEDADSRREQNGGDGGRD